MPLGNRLVCIQLAPFDHQPRAHRQGVLFQHHVGGILGRQNNFFSTTSAAYWLTTKSTSDLTEGSNLYFTSARADARFVSGLAGTTSVKSITTLPSLSLPYSQLTGTPDLSAYLTLSAWYATTTDVLDEDQIICISRTRAPMPEL